jgi:hypothetical protein
VQQRRLKHGFSISFYDNLLLPKSLRPLFVIPSKRDRQEEKEDGIRRNKTKRKMYYILKLHFAKEESTSIGMMKKRVSILCCKNIFLSFSKEYNRKENFLCFYMLYSAVERVIFSGKI